MKLAPRTFRIQWDLHAWAGVVASLFLFVIFFCGVFALFNEELSIWQDPALHIGPTLTAEGRPAAPSFDRLLAQVRAREALRPGQGVGFHVQHTTRLVTAYISAPDRGEERAVFVDPETGAFLSERSDLANQLYYMHFFNRVPGGMQASGVVGVVLLIALVSGLLIHLKDLGRQLWQFRPALRVRFSASDAHKVLGVFGLPFAVMFGWSGALLGLYSVLGATFAEGVYAGDRARVEHLSGYPPIEREATGRRAALRSLDELYALAQRAVGDPKAQPHYLGLTHLDDENAYLSVYFHSLPLEQEDAHAVLDAVSGAVLTASAGLDAPAAHFGEVLFDLHYAQYGGVLVKLLYALLALAVCGVIVTGNLVWIERRDPQRKRLGNRALERLTAGASSGLVAGTAVYFVANRSLPWDLADRAALEFAAFLATWAAGLVLAFVPRWSSRGYTAAVAAACAALLLAVVAADAAFLKTNVFSALTQGVPAVLVSELCILLVALACAALAVGLATRRAAHAA